MKKDRIFIIVFSLLFVTYVVVDMLSPKPISWTVTFLADDKNPFGSYILNDRSSDLFEGGFELSYNTISELAGTNNNLLILTEEVEIGGTDIENLFEILESGGSVLIGATSFNSKLKDTLEFDIHHEFQLLNQTIFEVPEATLTIRDSLTYTFPASLISNYFELENDQTWEKIGRSNDKPVAISRSFGSGKLILVSVPHVFTNFGMLYDENYRAVADILSGLPENDLHYTMFYKSGKREASTPFRYFLREDALRWSLYLGLLLIVLFLMISSWRKQRAIPIIPPPENTTIQYVKTLGALFYREKNHKKAAQKLISHFLGQVREQYFMTVDFNEKFYHHFASKSGMDTEHVVRTFELVQLIKTQPHIEEKTLIDLSKKIEAFK
ncbi:MAG: DUF4350 domain-containing protein [Cyclobacteriaceae bacterium]